MLSFVAILPVLAALLEGANAGALPDTRSLLDRRGHHNYKYTCPDNQQTYSCSCSDSEWAPHQCCNNERKCVQDSWTNEWQCCDAINWEFTVGCPKSYVETWGNNHRQKTFYGGNRQRYQEDCDNGFPNFWQNPGNCDSYPKPQRGHPAPPRFGNDHPQHDQPQHDQPQHDQPQHDQPKHDQPQHDQPKHDQPKHDQPQHPEHHN